MGKKTEEKSFEERLASLKKGCIILGVLQGLTVAMQLNNFRSGDGNLVSLLISVVLLAMLYFIYKYTAERNPLGPTLEKIFGGILIFDGIILCLSIILIPLGIIYIVVSLGLFKEADYFKAEIEGGGQAPTTYTEEPTNNPVEEMKSESEENNDNMQ